MFISITTSSQTEMIDITSRVQEQIKSVGITEGVCMVFVPHTTAGITINESADPDVKRDMLAVLHHLVPETGDYRHREGNSPAHVKATLTGSSVLAGVESGRLLLGTWQGIFFCEFDGPRERQVWVKKI